MSIFKSEIMILRVIVVAISLHLVFSYHLPEEDIHPDAASGPEEHKWAVVDEFPTQPGAIYTLSRLGRKLLLLKQTLIPYPRAGRMLDELDLSGPLVNEALLDNLDNPLTGTGFDKVEPLKRAHIGLPPGLGRKKRSVDGEYPQERMDISDKFLSRLLDTQVWPSLDDFDGNVFLRQDRMGHKSRNAFIPRVGKRRSSEDAGDLDKRAIAMTPRIGRAAFVPRIGRNDPKLMIQNRASFIPRIGKRETSRDSRSNKSRGDADKAEE